MKRVADRNTIRTFSGHFVDPLNIRVEDIRADDIAWALAHIARYGGQAHRFYSVAEHTLDVACRVPTKLRLKALLHDAAEAYIGDMPSPLKVRMPYFIQAEHRIMQAVGEAFGMHPGDFVRDIETGVVKREDTLAGKRERAFLWNPTDLILPGPSSTYLAALLFSELKEHLPAYVDKASLGLDKAHLYA